MSELIKLVYHVAVGVIIVDNPPINALRSRALNLLGSCWLRPRKTPAMQAVVLIGSRRTSIAGADINEFLEVLASLYSSGQAPCNRS